MSAPRIHRGRRFLGAILALLAASSLALVFAMPLVMSDPILALILMGLPLLFVALTSLAGSIAMFVTRVEIGPGGVSIRVPSKRYLPGLGLRRLTAGWDELRAVRHRREIYRLRIPPLFVQVPFAVDAYAFVTDGEVVQLAGRTIGDENEIAEEIARRAGLAIEDEGAIEADLLRAALTDAPPWPPREPGRRGP